MSKNPKNPKKRKKEIYLEWATLDDIFKELDKRNYNFVFAGELGEKTKIYFNRDIVEATRLTGEIHDLILNGLLKKGYHCRYTNSLAAILMILENLYNFNGDEEDEN